MKYELENIIPKSVKCDIIKLIYQISKFMSAPKIKCLTGLKPPSGRQKPETQI